MVEGKEGVDSKTAEKNISWRTDISEQSSQKAKLTGFSYWYLQYCLVTGLYMLEPWEKKLFNSVVFASSAISLLICYAILRAFA